MSDTNKYFTTHFTKTAKATTVSMVVIGFSCLIAAILLLVYFNAKSHLPLSTTINGVAVGNMTINEAKTTLEMTLSAPPQHTVSLRVDDIIVASTSSELGATYEIDQALTPLTGVPPATHTRTKLISVLQRYFSKHEQNLAITYDQAAVDQLIAQIQEKVVIPEKRAQLQLKASGSPASLTIFNGEQGRAVEIEHTKALLAQNAGVTDLALLVPVASTGAVLEESVVPAMLERGRKLVGKSIIFTREGVPFALSDTELVSFLKLPEGIEEAAVMETVSEWEESVKRPPQEPEFEYDKNTLAVTKFVPPRNGLDLDTTETISLVSQAIEELETTDNAEQKTIEKKLPLAETAPNKSLAETNDLGIKERIGFGESYYAHSIPNRIHNVALAAGKISLHIVKPATEFSFNKTIGDVSAATGFKSAYVIQGNRTVLGDGGGVCQVSSTLFRAILNAGLDVTRRLPHSYRVSYYELNSKPGIDATVYSGETDFRFKNDTDHAILIYGEADSKNLYMFYELYGTSDGRTTEIVDHKTWNFRPAPPPVYIPDPSLPPGKTVQVDWAAAGVSASFKHIIKNKAGEVMKEDTYVSNYRPWSAKYMQGVAQ